MWFDSEPHVRRRAGKSRARLLSGVGSIGARDGSGASLSRASLSWKATYIQMRLLTACSHPSFLPSFPRFTLAPSQITRHGPLDALYAQLPYVLVDKWSDITAAALLRWRQDITRRFGEEPFTHPNVTRLLNSSYWADLIRQRKSTIPDTVANATSIWKQCTTVGV